MSQASSEESRLKAISQDFKREALALDKERKLRLLSHPRSGTARKDPKANAAMECRESALPSILPRVLHYENIDILQPPSEEILPQPGLAGPRVPRPDAAVPASPAVKSAQTRRLQTMRGESQTVSKSLTAGWHRRVEAESLDPPSPRAHRTATTSLCSVLRPKGGATGKCPPDGSHPARPKQKRTVCLPPDKPQAFVGI